ncbi:putative exported protein [Vibrio astriarenae]|nr:putative exported protein [Vibrio sp. C7]
MERHKLNDHQLSIRHLSVTNDDTVYFAQQHQNPLGVMEPLLYEHQLGMTPKPLVANEQQWLEFEGYIGSVVASQEFILASSPKRGIVGVFERKSGTLAHLLRETDVCGIAMHNERFALSSGLGKLGVDTLTSHGLSHNLNLAWDNHLVWL